MDIDHIDHPDRRHYRLVDRLEDPGPALARSRAERRAWRRRAGLAPMPATTPPTCGHHPLTQRTADDGTVYCGACSWEGR